MTLWDKGTPIDARILAFTVGQDHLIDRKLVAYDCRASMVHAEMLSRMGILDSAELAAICGVLEEIIEKAACGEFPIAREQEDCHTAIEAELTRQLGDTGQKIHTARSRNDQVLTALRLYYKATLDEVLATLKSLRTALKQFAHTSGDVPLPGYTHMRKAMPSSVRLWSGAFREALKDDRRMVRAALELVDQSPLGTAAGYGVPLDIDRKFTADKLGFRRVQKNALYAQNSRGKIEGALLHALSQIMMSLNRMAGDLILFSMPEFGFFKLPAAFCTGSSIMPQKQNPDVLELIRSHAHSVLMREAEVKSRTLNLMSGYHRDHQLSKAPVMESLETTLACLEMSALMVSGLEVDGERCQAAMSEELFATEAAYRLVAQGVPFREAYRRVADKYKP